MAATDGLYCVPGAIPIESRDEHFRRAKRLFTEVLVRAQREHSGYAYFFDANEIVEIGLFVHLERRCCPFLAFTLSLPAESSEAELRVSGPAGTPGFLEAEFGHGRGPS